MEHTPGSGDVAISFLKVFQDLKLGYIKLSFNRKENKDDQLMAAQTYLKLGEVSAESGMSSIGKEISRHQTTEVDV